MKKPFKTNKELLEENNLLKQQISEFERSELEHITIQKALRESEERFRSIFDNSLDGIVIAEPDGSIFSANPAACKMLRRSEQEIREGGRNSFLDLSDPNLRKYLTERKRTGQFIGEINFKRKDGSLFSVDVSSSIFILPNGELRTINIFRDITRRKLMEEELERYRNQLEEMIEKRTEELESKNTNLHELNAALKVLLKRREDDKKDLEERFVMNVQNLVLPYIEQMKKSYLDTWQKFYLNIIESHLKEITTPLIKYIRQFNLTPMEIKVASLVKQGKSTKEIANMLKISAGSIDVHRKHIREKLGLNNRKVNLLSFLESLN